MSCRPSSDSGERPDKHPIVLVLDLAFVVCFITVLDLISHGIWAGERAVLKSFQFHGDIKYFQNTP